MLGCSPSQQKPQKSRTAEWQDPIRARWMVVCLLWGPEPWHMAGMGVLIGSMNEHPSLGVPSFSDAPPSNLYPTHEPPKWPNPFSRTKPPAEQGPNSAPLQPAKGLTPVVSPHIQSDFGQQDGPTAFSHTILPAILICVRFSWVTVKLLKAWASRSSCTLKHNNWHLEAHGHGKEKNKQD